jgi:hypothetical protein
MKRDCGFCDVVTEDPRHLKALGAMASIRIVLQTKHQHHSCKRLADENVTSHDDTAMLMLRKCSSIKQTPRQPGYMEQKAFLLTARSYSHIGALR